MAITELLRRVHAGDRQALAEVVPLVYGELKRLASSHLRREGHPVPLETTELVHEAFLRLAGSRHPLYENRSHFYGIASRLMRQVLVEMARARKTEKRSGAEPVVLAEIPDLASPSDDSFLALNDALERLDRTDPLKVKLIEMRFFAGMTAEESAEALCVSVHLVRRELQLAQAWLRKEITP